MSLPIQESVDPDLPRMWIQPHYSSFNGLRAVAVLGVFLAHYGILWGVDTNRSFFWTGVDLFFVLSGFLITGILYDALHGPRYFRDFYTRRALRIFPIFYASFALLLLLTPLLHLVYPPLVWSYFLYVGNLVFPFYMKANLDISMLHMVHSGAVLPAASIGHLWSLCVEEQFYLIWPMVVWCVRDRRRLMRLCVTLCVLVFTLRVYLQMRHNLPFLLYESTYTRFDTILVGAWMALWLRDRSLSLRQLRRISTLMFWIPCLILLLMVLRIPPGYPFLALQSRFVTTIGFTLIALAYGGLILRSLDDSSRVSRVLRWRPLQALGVISYGFYLTHMLPYELLSIFAVHHPPFTPAVPVIAFLLTLTLATLSFRYLETPFLRLKRVLAPQRSREAATTHMHVSEPAA